MQLGLPLKSLTTIVLSTSQRRNTMNHHIFSDDRFGRLWKRLVKYAKRHYSDLDPEELAGTAIQRVLATKSIVAKNRLYKYLRTTLNRLAYRKLRSRLPMLSLQHEPIQQVDCHGSPTSQIEALRSCIQQLNPKLRIVVELNRSGVSTTEIAHQLGLSSSAVRARLTKARSILKHRLTQ